MAVMQPVVPDGAALCSLLCEQDRPVGMAQLHGGQATSALPAAHCLSVMCEVQPIARLPH